MIVVSNRVQIAESHAETFIQRLEDSYGIEEQPGFLGLKLLAPIDAETYITMTFWESVEDYETWKDDEAFERAHSDRSSEKVFTAPNEVEIHDVAIERDPESNAQLPSRD